MKRVLSTVVIATLALTSIAQDEKVDLSWKPQVGLLQTYKMTSNMGMEMQGQSMNISVQMTTAGKVISVEDGKVTVEGEVKAFQILMDGQDLGEMAGPSPVGQKSKEVFKMDGTQISSTQTEEMGNNPRVQRLSHFYYPTEKIAMGGEWFKEVAADKENEVPAGKYKYTLEKAETVGGVAAYRVKYVYSEMDGDSPFSAMGTFWMDQKDMTLVKMESEFQNVKFVEMMPPTNAKVTVVRS